jgi:hypothetical protein
MYGSIVDSGYPNKKGYLAPYKGQRYHVSEWQHGRTPMGLKEVFNHAHSSLRNMIEKSFGVLQMKWHIHLKMPKYLVTKQQKIVVACMALHNFIRDNSTNDCNFQSHIQEDGTHGPESSLGEGSGSGDDMDMSALHMML